MTGERRPVLRGWIHAAACVAWLPVAFWLVSGALPQFRWAVVVYAAAVLSTVLVSAVYHIVATSPASQRVWQRVDHSMIFVLVCGTYVPVCVAVLSVRASMVLIGCVTVVSVLGALLRAAGRARRFASSLYIVTGWLSLLALPQLWAASPLATALTALGGVSYTAGAFMFYRRWPSGWPSVFGYHEVFHVCTLLGVAAQCAAIAILTR